MAMCEFYKFAERLLKITENCRYDMHEPDEQGIKARVIGDHLDNACGEDIKENAIVQKYQEFVIILEKDKIEFEKFNLATLIALARIGARHVSDLKDQE